MGSILVARRAGTQHAIAAATETIETATATRTGFESEQNGAAALANGP